MRFMGEICRRQEAFRRFLDYRRSDVSTRKKLRRIKQYGLPPYNYADPVSATTRDISQRVIYERQRYLHLLIGKQPITPQMESYGRRMIAGNVIIVNFKLKKPGDKTALFNVAEGAKIIPFVKR